MNTKLISRSFIKAPPRPLIEPGTYLGKIVSADYCFAFSSKVLIKIELLDQQTKVVIPFFCNVKVDPGTRQMIEPGKSSKLTKVWRVLRPGVPVSEIDLDQFVGLICEINVKTSNSCSDGTEAPRGDWYSVVSDVLALVKAADSDINEPFFEDDIPF